MHLFWRNRARSAAHAAAPPSADGRQTSKSIKILISASGFSCSSELTGDNGLAPTEMQ